jgi:cytoskeletal protein CcmA (bactofilin family)
VSTLRKIQAGAIQYVLVISVIIMIVLFAFISLVFLQNRLQAKSELYKTAIQNTYTGFDYLAQKDIPYNKEASIQFSDFEYEQTRIEKKHWGVFDLVIVSSQLKNEISTKVALVGNSNADRKALSLQENNQPLVVVGNTKIIGDVVLPKRGVKSGSIAGTSYYGEELIYGKVERNSITLPAIKNIEYLEQLVSDLPFENIKSFNLEEGIIINQSFSKETFIFETPLSLSLGNMSLSGNIVIKSNREIKVKASTKLNDVILIAPKIVVESGFEGSFQAIASKEIDISENVKLSYPSSLVLIGKMPQNVNEKQRIEINRGSDVKGIVLYQGDQKNSNYDAQIKIYPKARVTGEIFCNKNLELGGKVEGFVFANNFVTKQFGRTYVNHIYNAEINSEVIPQQYAGLLLGNIKPTVAKWVD